MAECVKLRALEPEDLELVYQIENDPALWACSASSQPLSRYTIRQYLADQHNDIFIDGQLRQVVTLDDANAVGIVDLTDFEPRHRRAEVGIVILADHHRQGIATAALHQLQQYAAERLRLRSLYAYVSVANEPAQRLFRSLGYQPCGQLQRWIEGETTVTLFQLML